MRNTTSDHIVLASNILLLVPLYPSPSSLILQSTPPPPTPPQRVASEKLGFSTHILCFMVDMPCPPTPPLPTPALPCPRHPLSQRVAAEKLGLSEQELDQRLQEVYCLLPDLRARLANAPPDMVATLACSTQAIAGRLLRLKAAFPRVGRAGWGFGVLRVLQAVSG